MYLYNIIMYKEYIMSRIKKLESHYQKQLTDHKVKDTPVFIQFIVDADITKGKYARFLIECFLNNKFLEEDLVGGLDSTIGQAISLFDKHKNKLPLEYRSVYAVNQETGEALYQSPGDLWNSVKQFQGELSGKELKKEEQEKIYRETEFIYKDEETGFQIVSPLTEESAKWWGKGTRWCTSAENNNMFWDYAKDAPLFILLMPNKNNISNKNKLQLWKSGNRIQFMDEVDNSVPLEYIKQHWSLLEPICLWLNDIRFIPENCMTEDICKNIIKHNGKLLKIIPVYLRTKEVCELAIKQDGLILKLVPEYIKTKEMCELAIKQDGLILKLVPDKYKTKEMCELAVQQNGMALQYVPDELRTKKICEMAIKQNGASLGYISTELRTKELCELAVQNNGFAIYYIPDELKTPELCKLAVKQDGNALEYIPVKLRTKEVCELSVSNNGWALYHVPEQLRTPELCKLAINNNSHAIKYVPDELLTPELYKLAIKNNGLAIQHILEQYRTPELYELAVKNDGLLLQHIPIKFRTKKICELAISNNGMSIQFTPRFLIKEELCIKALMQNSNSLKPISYRQIEICTFAQSLVKNMPILHDLQNRIDTKNDIQQKYTINIFQSRYEKMFQEFKEYFPQNNLSLDIK